MNDLESYILDNMKYLKINDGENFVAIYKGYSIVPDRFNPGKNIVSYLLKRTDSNKTINWNNGSNKVAVQMKKIPVGETITIYRRGQGMDTKYKIVVTKANQVNDNNDAIEPHDEDVAF